MTRKRCKRLVPREDRLSGLPDLILCHILSFLPTKHSAATSILSKRWNSLWLSVLTLDLVAKNLSDIGTFDRVVLLRDINVPIQTLRLKCNVMVEQCLNKYHPIPGAEYYPIYLRQLVNINQLRHCLPISPRQPEYQPMGVRQQDYRFLPIVYNPNTINPLITEAIQRGLETLELDMELLPLGVQLSSTIFSCKTLTVLKLRDVIISMKHLPRINDSHLKTLHLDRVNFGCNTDIINFLLLFPTLEELQTNELLVDKFTPETEINKCLRNLMRARISDSKNIPLFLLSKALILSIKLTSTHLIPIQVPTFQHLTQIELFFKLDSKKWEWMHEMLQHSPKLQHLIINEQRESGDDEDDWQEPYVVPECLLSQLKTCLIRNCGGRKCELQFEEYVMRNSKVLRTMTIHSSCSIGLKAKSQVVQKLSLCPRSCDLIFD